MSDPVNLQPDWPASGGVHEQSALDLESLRPACLACGAKLVGDELYARLRVCPRCRFHYHMAARQRISGLADEDSFKETSGWIQSLDPLEFSARVSYRSRVIQDQNRTGLKEAAVTGTCSVGGHDVVVIVLDFGFLGGSMGLVVGEKVALALELAADKRFPAVTVVTSGGARIQEGVLSLMQMAKTVLAAQRLRNAGVPSISVLGNPATGQVLASFASMSDIIFAEPGAHIGFAPYRAIQEVSGEGHTAGEYTSEDFLSHGQVDRLVDRERLKVELASVLDLLAPEFKTEARKKVRTTRPKLTPREPWDMVQVARHPGRPKARDYISAVFADFVELQGDRLYGNDPSVVCGLARIGVEPVMVVGQQKGKTAGECFQDDNGLAMGPTSDTRGEIMPEGFRKTARAVRMAARFKLPVIALADTPGPMLGLDMERRGLANSIAGLIDVMLSADTPTISVLIGEGGSEAALAFGVADRVLMLQNAIYTPIAPETGAATEMRDPKRASDMARILKLTSTDCMEMRVIDAVIPEPADGAHAAPEEAARLLRRTLMIELLELKDVSLSSLLKDRQRKFRNMGEYRGQVRGAVRSELRTWRSVLTRGFRRKRRRDQKRQANAEGAATVETVLEGTDLRATAASKNGTAAGAGVVGPEPTGMPDHEPVEQPRLAPSRRRSRLRSVFLRRRKKQEGEPAAAPRPEGSSRKQSKKEPRPEEKSARSSGSEAGPDTGE